MCCMFWQIRYENFCIWGCIKALRIKHTMIYFDWKTVSGFCSTKSVHRNKWKPIARDPKPVIGLLFLPIHWGHLYPKQRYVDWNSRFHEIFTHSNAINTDMHQSIKMAFKSNLCTYNELYKLFVGYFNSEMYSVGIWPVPFKWRLLANINVQLVCYFMIMTRVST